MKYTLLKGVVSGVALMSGMLLASCAMSDQVVAPPTDVHKPVSDMSPSELFPGLFEVVSESKIYPTKDWVDAVPKASPEDIMAAYDMARPLSEGEIEGFVESWFEMPDNAGGTIELAADRTMIEHIDALWPDLAREGFEANQYASLLSLPNDYIVPGGRFRELYYWDAYFTMAGMGADYQHLKESMVENFTYLIDQYGFVPNANRTYYLSRSQPPFFFMMVGLMTPENPALSHARYLDALKAEHAFWMDGERELAPGEAALRVVKLSDGTVLNRYYDARAIPREESYNDDVETAQTAPDRPDDLVYRDLRAGAESGWDYSSRWFAGEDLTSIHTTDIVPVDLNALLFGLETAIAGGCAEAGLPCADKYAALAQSRRAAIEAYLWNDALKTYDDLDFVTGRLKGNKSAAAVYPLFFGVATPQRAAFTAEFVREHLLAEGGLLTTTERTGQQWDAPNGWAPLHWLAVNGLARYGEDELAETIARRWLSTTARTFCETGKMVEKYDVAKVRPGGGGEYPNQDGFGWTNGVTAALLDLYPDLSVFGDVSVHARTSADSLVTEACAETVSRL